ncbi:MAG: hypothetical protein AAF694_09400 [Bacteroidota bacterium]
MKVANSIQQVHALLEQNEVELGLRKLKQISPEKEEEIDLAVKAYKKGGQKAYQLKKYLHAVDYFEGVRKHSQSEAERIAAEKRIYFFLFLHYYTKGNSLWKLGERAPAQKYYENAQQAYEKYPEMEAEGSVAEDKAKAYMETCLEKIKNYLPSKEGTSPIPELAIQVFPEKKEEVALEIAQKKSEERLPIEASNPELVIADRVRFKLEVIAGIESYKLQKFDSALQHFRIAWSICPLDSLSQLLAKCKLANELVEDLENLEASEN